MVKNLLIDFDSTIINAEVLDFLLEHSLQSDFCFQGADKVGLISEINQITTAGMRGKIGFSESLQRRLRLLKVHQRELGKVVKLLRNKISRSFIASLPHLKKFELQVISGGFGDLIIPLLKPLGLESSMIHANKLVFDANGWSTGCDMRCPLVHDQGKVKMVESLNLSGPMVVVGDGYTDYEIKASGLAEYFIYYAEFVQRSSVMKRADFVANDFYQVIEYLDQTS